MKRTYGLETVSGASSTESVSATGDSSLHEGHPEWTTAGLSPVAHWVKLPDGKGGRRLSMVWEVPNPMPYAAH
ncbi:hypothetical protein [Kineosporia sp. NBRC 101731]|uniref:hypothetical protein n=1 Tax=Kineosporia sp. NBRC 101731 TaxID=3032199 RepID=UPI0024A0A30C|nr:hypothetical protein [Kineosporia sp. NBRC 101731]GLY31182.1 hypothetical protein Kisp02_45470 [Kineosporia sp. NBRC 101731]